MKFKSQVYTQVSGSIGGVTYAHNRGGMYTRARSIPVNTETSRRTAIRAAFATAVAAWNASLTAAQRGDWAAYAAATPVVDVFGDEKTLTGQQMFVRTNTLREQGNLALVLDAPSSPGLAIGVQAYTSTEINVGGADFNLAGNLVDAMPDDGDVFVFIGAMMSAGRAYYNGPYQLCDVIAVASAATTFVNASLSYPPLGSSDRSPAEDDLYSFRAVVVYDDGRVSNPYRSIETITQGV